MDDDIFAAFMGLIATGLIFGALLLGGRQIHHHIEVSACRTFGQTSGYETRFVDYNFVRYECQAKTSNNKWIPSDNLRDID